jgi:hypothetical protein
MSPQMIESIAVSQLTEHREAAERLRLRKQARSESRRVRQPAAGHSIWSRVHCRRTLPDQAVLGAERLNELLREHLA